MRANIPRYDMWSPGSLEEALRALEADSDTARPFAGGTDLMVLLEAGMLPPGRFMHIWGLEELKGIQSAADHVTIGALTTYAEIRENPLLREEFGMLGEAARETGALAIQNRGTLGGNIINASPAADTPPALLVYDAEVELVSLQGSRWVPYAEFHKGYKTTMCQQNELLRAVRVPRPSGVRQSYYRKVGTRKAQAISKVCIAATATMQGAIISDVRLAFGSVAPIPLRCTATERVLRGKAATPALIAAARGALEGELAPIDDIRSTASYRLRVSSNLLADWLGSLLPAT